MTREELLKSESWWLANIQSDLYGIITDYMRQNNIKKKDVANMLGVSKGYVSQIMNGDFDHKLSKLIQIALVFGKAPKLQFIDLEKYIQDDACRISAKHKDASMNIVLQANDFVTDENVEKAEKYISESAILRISSDYKN